MTQRHQGRAAVNSALRRASLANVQRRLALADVQHPAPAKAHAATAQAPHP